MKPAPISGYHGGVRTYAWLLAAVLVFGCRASEQATDAGVVATDGPVADASTGDAGPCGSQLLFTGEYIDWDITTFQGIFDATVSEVGNPDNAASTAPNGRVVLCLPADRRSVVAFVHDDYLPLRYTLDPSSALDVFSLRGLTPARADELFATELGLALDSASAQVLVEVRARSDGAPAVGAAVTLGNVSAGGFTDGGDGVYRPGDTVTSGASILFANVDVVGGSTTVTVTPPTGMTCSGPDTLALAAGEVTVATFTCA